MTHSEEVLSPDFELFGLKRPGSGAFTPPAPPRRETISLELSLITPMFGGSTEAGQVDPDRPVNAKSIRGHLRFWWRACRAGQFASAEDMFRREAEIWGAAGEYGTDGKPVLGQGAVDLEVAIKERGQPVPCATYRKQKRDPTQYQSMPQFNDEYPAYALFPFQGKLAKDRRGIEVPPTKCLERLTFVLRLSVPGGVREEVDCALRAWILFGGVGARTRRGCGALAQAPPSDKWLHGLADLFSPHGRAEWAMFPQLGGSCVLLGERQNHLQAWSTAVNLMRDFRQRPDFARNPGRDNRPGRSRWPEPDSIRDVRRQWAEGHEPSHPARPFYPRADLGLPIVFHFKDGNRGDPQDPDPTLEAAGKDKTRMASAIILKPVAISESQSVPLVLLLNTPHIYDEAAPGAKLKEVRGQSIARTELLNAAKAGQVAPMKGEPDVRKAFLNFARNNFHVEREVIL
ncbi:MAG: type III-B CRISPR module RAMP protein Cmr1 [Armatimonadota bacterium]